MSIAIPQLTKNLNHSVNGMLTEKANELQRYASHHSGD